MPAAVPSTREECLELDRRDPLAPFREEFVLPEGIVYLDGNSLGARPKGASERAAQVIEQEWGEGLIRSWNTAEWFTLPARLGDMVGRYLGGSSGTAVVTDTTSINLFKAASAALRIVEERSPGRRVIVTQRENFPSDIYMMEGLAEQLGQGYEVRLVEDEDLVSRPESVIDESVALVLLTHVNYRTGRLFEMKALTEVIHRAGAMALWDLCHSAGALPIDLEDANADMAVGCTYKYLNGGPGSPAFIWVAERHQDAFAQPLSGWWGHKEPFAMTPHYEPASGIRRYLTGTQGIISMSVAELGLTLAARADIEEVRAKSLALTDLFIELVRTRLADHPLTLVTPLEHEHRGSQVSITHPEGFAVMSALIARGFIGDYREPEILRFGFTPLYTSYADVWDTVEALRDILDNRLWDKDEFKTRGAVT